MESRLAARALDLGILVVLYIVMIVVLGALSLFGFGFPVVPFLVLMALPLAYETFFWIQCEGATPGKMVTNIKIVRPDGSPISVEQALGRSAFFTYIPFMPFIVLATVLADPGRRGLHDIVADTMVVRNG